MGPFSHNYANYAKTRFFFEKPALSLFIPQAPLTSYQISEQTNEWKYENFGDGQTNRLTNGLTIYPESNSTEVENC